MKAVMTGGGGGGGNGADDDWREQVSAIFYEKQNGDRINGAIIDEASSFVLIKDRKTYDDATLGQQFKQNNDLDDGVIMRHVGAHRYGTCRVARFLRELSLDYREAVSEKLKHPPQLRAQLPAVTSMVISGVPTIRGEERKNVWNSEDHLEEIRKRLRNAINNNKQQLALPGDKTWLMQARVALIISSSPTPKQMPTHDDIRRGVDRVTENNWPALDRSMRPFFVRQALAVPGMMWLAALPHDNNSGGGGGGQNKTTTTTLVTPNMYQLFNSIDSLRTQAVLVSSAVSMVVGTLVKKENRIGEFGRAIAISNTWRDILLPSAIGARRAREVHPARQQLKGHRLGLHDPRLTRAPVVSMTRGALVGYVSRLHELMPAVLFDEIMQPYDDGDGSDDFVKMAMLAAFLNPHEALRKAMLLEASVQKGREVEIAGARFWINVPEFMQIGYAGEAVQIMGHELHLNMFSMHKHERVVISAEETSKYARGPSSQSMS